MKKGKIKLLEDENRKLKDFIIALNLIIAQQKEYLENMCKEIEHLRGNGGNKISWYDTRF